MQIFITGGTGYVGTVLVEQFLRAGHRVVALARSEQSAVALTRHGAEPLSGSLADPTILQEAATRADAVVHVAVDYAVTEESVATELGAVTALLRGAGSAGKPFLYTSTGLVYGFDPDQDRDEKVELPPVSAQPFKVVAEELVRNAPGVTGIVIRAGLVHGRGGSGLVTGLIQAARDRGAATYVGAGANAWSPVHVDDLARLYELALERPVAGTYNAVGPVPFTFRDLAEAIADLTGTSATSITIEEAVAVLGPLAGLLQTTATMPATRARTTFGWEPSGPGLLEDVRAGSYRDR